VIVILAIILVASIVVFAVLISRLHKKLRAFMAGKDAASLEATLQWLTEKSASVDGTLAAHKEALEMIDARVKRSIRGYSLVRYNAYDDAGGEQSFASGLLDEHGDGYILSVLTNRNHVGVYAKRINRGTPESTLTAEESDALKQAHQKTKHSLS
jgi:hypothetical protein